MQLIENILSKSVCDKLITIAENAQNDFKPSTGFRRRMGKNGLKRLSQYHTLKKWRLPRETRLELLKLLPQSLQTQHNEAWFLRFDKGGFFDEYQSKESLFNVLSIPLKDGGVFKVDGKKLVNHAGSGYWFNLTEAHEVTKTRKEELYLVFIIIPSNFPELLS